MAKKILSYILGFGVGLLSVAPPLSYSIPVVVNSYWWLYGVVVAALLSIYLAFTDLPLALKTIAFYLLTGCFISMVPYISFNAFILVVGALYCYIGFTKCDYEIVIDIIVAAFFMQVFITVMQLFGMEKLMNFDRKEPVFFGTVFQYMRFSSLLAIMTPFLVLKNKAFIFLITLLVIMSHSSGFALSVIAGCAVYFFMTNTQSLIKFLVLVTAGICTTAYFVWDWESVNACFEFGRIPVWADILRSWCMDTWAKATLPLSGPFNLKSVLFGRGLDTFLPLFPIFKHDPNPFAQAHNCHLQLLFEIGIIGYGILAAYIVNLIRRVWDYPILVAGLVCMGVNMFFAFPTRITQTMFMMVAFIALAEQVARGEQTCQI